MLTRIKEAWKVLTGKGQRIERPKYVCVTSSEPENKFVQLVYFEGRILALDAQGKIWILDYRPCEYPYSFTTQLVQESPRPYAN